MKNSWLLLLFVTLSGTVYASDMDITQDFIKCAQTKNGAARLQCYDSIEARIIKENNQLTSSLYPQYRKMDLVDLKTDIRKLFGKKVAVTGMLQMFAGVAMLKTDALDATPVMVDIDHLPRDDRRHIFSDCSTVCNIEVLGHMEPGVLGGQIVADRLAW